MGITNHWVSMLAHKFNDKIEFWYFDSKNRDYLAWNKDETSKWYNEEN